MTERPLLAKDSAEVGPASEKAQSLLPDPFEPIGSMRSVAPTVTGIFGAETPAGADEPAQLAVLGRVEADAVHGSLHEGHDVHRALRMRDFSRIDFIVEGETVNPTSAYSPMRGVS